MRYKWNCQRGGDKIVKATSNVRAKTEMIEVIRCTPPTTNIRAILNVNFLAVF